MANVSQKRASGKTENHVIATISSSLWLRRRRQRMKWNSIANLYQQMQIHFKHKNNQHFHSLAIFIHFIKCICHFTICIYSIGVCHGCWNANSFRRSQATNIVNVGQFFPFAEYYLYSEPKFIFSDISIRDRFHMRYTHSFGLYVYGNDGVFMPRTYDIDKFILEFYFSSHTILLMLQTWFLLFKPFSFPKKISIFNRNIFHFECDGHLINVI